MSDEDELLILIEEYQNPHPRQHVHRPGHLVATQFDLDADLQAQRAFTSLFFVMRMIILCDAVFLMCPDVLLWTSFSVY